MYVIYPLCGCAKFFQEWFAMIKFERHPEIATVAEVKSGLLSSGCFKAAYRNDYDAIFTDVASGKFSEKMALRSLFANDLWFLVNYGFRITDKEAWNGEKAHHPFVVQMCQMVETGPRADTLDIWARGHWKSTVITQAETIQFQIKNPDCCSGIFAYSRPAAKKPLTGLKNLLETSELLQWCFDDVLWKRPDVEAPKWSLDEGLIFKRTNHSRGESSIESWGLTEGMPTGRHYERVVFDDLETEDIRESPDMLAKVFSKFQMAFVNLGTMSKTNSRRIIGTYYSHFGPNVKIGNMAYPDGRKVFALRIVPGSKDGTRGGDPVLMDAESWELAKTGEHFNSQQLCDPTPSSEIRLNGSYLRPVEPAFIPKSVYKFMVLDQAGGDETNKQSGDLWSYGVLGIEPILDDIGQSNVYLLDIEADKMSHSEGIDGIVRMYLRNGIIQQMGVEKAGMSTTEIHITNALRMRGRRLSLDAGNLVLLKPAGRSKEKRVETALQWPLNNGKLFYSTAIPRKYIDAITEEMQKFPFYHVDILDMWAYAYDMFKEFRFPITRATNLRVAVASNPLLFGLRDQTALAMR